jgi:class 3 adenylate cyclase
MRKHSYAEAERLLDEIQPAESNILLRAEVAHLQAANFFHAGEKQRVLPLLGEALRLMGREHLGAGRVLDTYGMFHASRDDFFAAEEFYRQALVLKRGWDDQPGLAVTHGNLGRLYLEWGHLDRSEVELLADLEIARNIRDVRGEALIHNALGRVALEKGRRSSRASRPVDARSHFEEAAGWLDSSIQAASAGQWSVLEGYARKDRAALRLAEDQLDETLIEAKAAEALFESVAFREGLAHIRRVEGAALRRLGRFDEAKSKLRAALDHFTEVGEKAEQALSQWEIARLDRDSGQPRPLVTREFLNALTLAESSRRDHLVREIGEELKSVNPEAQARHIFRRVRGRGMPDDTDSLVSGISEPLTALFLDLKGSTAYALNTAPEVVMMTLNRMMAEMQATLRQHDALVSVFRGDGFLALFRGQDNAARAVAAGLELCRRVEEFNGPREILGLKPFAARVGISTGAAVLGNVGTYDLMSYTAIGTTVNLGARLEAEGIPGFPCISRKTYEEVRGRFRYREVTPRRIMPKGLEELGEQDVWDVVS